MENNMLKLAVVGSRSFNDYLLLKDTLKEYLPFTLISGGAKGADSLSERFAEESKLGKIIFMPEWAKYGKRAGIIRNRQIVEKADKLVAFWDGNSPGTKSSIDFAEQKGIEVNVVKY